MTTKDWYHVSYISGGGTEYEDGEWIVTRTQNTIRVEKVKEYMSGIYAMHKVGFKARVGTGTGNPIKHEHQHGFTVYFKQAGIPYLFEKLNH